MKELYTDSCR